MCLLSKTTCNEIIFSCLLLARSAPDEVKHISANSILRPVDYPEYLPEELPMELKVLTFHEDIPEWLGECMDKLPAENTPLRNLIAQYIEYCKQL